MVILVFGLKIGVDLAVNRGLWFVVAGLEKKDEKLKKMMQKDVQFAVCFQNRAKIPLKRRGGLSIYYSRFTIDYL